MYHHFDTKLLLMYPVFVLSEIQERASCKCKTI